MRVFKTEVKRHPFAAKVTVSRTRTGRWIIDHYPNRSEVPADTFANWDEAQWTGTQWANEELEAEALAS